MSGHCARASQATALATLLLLAGCRETIRPTSPDEFVLRAWDAYKTTYIHPDGYVLDRARNSGEVTSEGQGYALLRAVWMRDESCFRQVLDWTNRRLRRPDGLFMWRWAPEAGGQVKDPNTAADADQETAFALILASVVFSKPEYRDRARALLESIRTHESIAVPQGWFPAAGNWAVRERVINLSYFVPYAYPYFEQVDPGAGWARVADVGYDLLAAAMREPGVQLLPDFMSVDVNGAMTALPKESALSRDFSSDAMRIFWRIAVDCRLHRSLRACAEPLRVEQLTDLMARDGALFTRYTSGGVPVERTESYSFYGAALPYLDLYAPTAARAVEADRLTTAALDVLMHSGDRYYDANWVWFGVAARDGFIEQRTPAVSAASGR
jgi:endo-1,4-beta-D-glucanase Y